MRGRHLVICCAAVVIAAPSTADAQLLRGSVRSATTSLGIAEVQVTVRDTSGIVLALTTSDADGAWSIRLRRRPAPLVVQARRIGFTLVATEPRTIAPTDTVDLEFLLGEVATPTEATVVTGMASLNEQRLRQAQQEFLKQLPEDHLEFLRSLKTSHTEGDYLFVNDDVKSKPLWYQPRLLTRTHWSQCCTTMKLYLRQKQFHQPWKQNQHWTQHCLHPKKPL